MALQIINYFLLRLQGKVKFAYAPSGPSRQIPYAFPWHEQWWMYVRFLLKSFSNVAIKH